MGRNARELGGAAVEGDLRLWECDQKCRVSPIVTEFHHGQEPRAEEIALHQKYLTLEGEIDAARLEGDEREVRRLTPFVKRAKARWIKANRRVTRGER